MDQLATERLSLLKEVEQLNKKVTEARGALIKVQNENVSSCSIRRCIIPWSLLPLGKEGYCSHNVCCVFVQHSDFLSAGQPTWTISYYMFDFGIGKG